MDKKYGFSGFEFYFVITVIGILIMIGLHRYTRLAENIQIVRFNVIAQHFNVAVNNYHTHWILTKDSFPQLNRPDIPNIHATSNGWPTSLDSNSMGVALDPQVVLEGCRELWNSLLQNPAPIVFEKDAESKNVFYQVSLTPSNGCRYALREDPENYFAYLPATGEIFIHISDN